MQGEIDLSLQSAFDLELSTVDTTLLQRLRKLVIQQLKAATQSHRHPWHVAVVATCQGAEPRVRNVVLRSVGDVPLTLRFHTDLRSQKTEQIAVNSNLEWLFYEHKTRIQIRLRSQARIVTQGSQWQAAWEATSLPSRRCYLGPYAPGTVCEEPNVNLPSGMEHRNPSQEESHAGMQNFAIVNCQIERMEWLYLRHDGHLRCSFERDAQDLWNASWLAP